jgi:hypothetical protein
MPIIKEDGYCIVREIEEMDGTIVHMKVECSKDQLPLLGGRQDEKYVKRSAIKTASAIFRKQQSNQSTRQRAQPSTRQQNRQSTRQRHSLPQDSRTGSQQGNGHSLPQDSRTGSQQENSHKRKQNENVTVCKIRKSTSEKAVPKKPTRVSRGRQGPRNCNDTN